MHQDRRAIGRDGLQVRRFSDAMPDARGREVHNNTDDLIFFRRGDPFSNSQVSLAISHLQDIPVSRLTMLRHLISI